MNSELKNNIDSDVETDGLQDMTGGGDVDLIAPVISRILGIGERRLRQLCELGMPRTARGLYPLVGCVHWYGRYLKRQSAARANFQRDRKLGLQADILEFRLEKMRGNFLPKAEMQEAANLAYRGLAQYFERLPFTLGREFNWSLSETRACQSKLDEARRGFVDYMEAEIKRHRNESPNRI